MAAPLTHQNVVVNCYTAQETVELCSRSGVAKANMRLDKMFISSVLAGMLLAFACAASLSTQTAPWYQENAPGLIRMIGAVIFPFGLTMIVVTGADLCTGSFMVSCSARQSDWSVLLTSPPCTVHYHFGTPRETLRMEDAPSLGYHVCRESCWVSWEYAREYARVRLTIGQSSLFIACLLMGEGGVFDSDPFKTQAINFANKKVVGYLLKPEMFPSTPADTS
jgi:hypothetical protein